jgi:hypothetical protein
MNYIIHLLEGFIQNNIMIINKELDFDLFEIVDKYDRTKQSDFLCAIDIIYLVYETTERQIYVDDDYAVFYLHLN